MAKTKTQEIHDAVVEYAEGRGVGVLRETFGKSMQGEWPGAIFLLPGGKPLFVKFKSRGKNPTARQQQKIDILDEADYEVAVIDDIEEGINLVEEYLYDIGSGNF